eukprot:2402099-Pyramimonas_sp.AAC.1
MCHSRVCLSVLVAALSPPPPVHIPVVGLAMGVQFGSNLAACPVCARRFAPCILNFKSELAVSNTLLLGMVDSSEG